jgi:hypothetical protein
MDIASTDEPVSSKDPRNLGPCEVPQCTSASPEVGAATRVQAAAADNGGSQAYAAAAAAPRRQPGAVKRAPAAAAAAVAGDEATILVEEQHDLPKENLTNGQEIFNAMKRLAEDAEALLPQEDEKEKKKKRPKKELTLVEALQGSWQGKVSKLSKAWH